MMQYAQHHPIDGNGLVIFDDLTIPTGSMPDLRFSYQTSLLKRLAGK
jgi:hypothetical protein